MAIIPQETRVALLCGGKSGEREISLSSGKGVQAALIEAGFIVTVLDPADRHDLVRLIEENFDVAFIALHGKYGEDGTIQGFLETIDLPYTGSGVWSSATALDKARAKVMYERFGIRTPKSIEFTAEDGLTAADIIDQVGVDCVIKATTEGSALGVYICHSADEITEANKSVFEIDSYALAETFVAGDEYTIAVLGNEQAKALPVIQIVPMNEFYDFESKYAVGGSEHICPAPLAPEQTAQAQGLALAAHQALGCKGVSRTDLIRDNQGLFWVLETNTIPGMTATSLLPDAARADGISFSEVCTMMIENALA